MVDDIPPDEVETKRERGAMGLLFVALLGLAVGLVSVFSRDGWTGIGGILSGLWDVLVIEPKASFFKPTFWATSPVGMFYTGALWLLILEGCGRVAIPVTSFLYRRFKGFGQGILGRLRIPKKLASPIHKGFAFVATLAICFLVLLPVAAILWTALRAYDVQRVGEWPSVLGVGIFLSFVTCIWYGFGSHD